MLDRDGYRPNVGIVICNARNEVFWGKRAKEHSWQFPQGGINHGESPVQAMYRELWEEVGLLPEHVRVLGRTREWLRYEVPSQWIRREWRGAYRGQKQIWFLLRMVGRDCDVCLRSTSKPEFDAWRWNEYWSPLETVIEFKREVYELALTELERFLHREPGRRGARHDARRDDGMRTEAQDPEAPCAEEPGRAVQDGAVQDGAAKDGAAKDGAAKDGAAKDGVVHDASVQDASVQRASAQHVPVQDPVDPPQNADPDPR